MSRAAAREVLWNELLLPSGTFSSRASSNTRILLIHLPARRFTNTNVVAAEALTENVSAETRPANIPAETLLHPETVRRLACDGGLLTIVEKGNGDPLNVGRKTRCCAAATFALYMSSGITFGG